MVGMSLTSSVGEDDIRSVTGPGADRDGPEETARFQRMLLGVERGADRLATGRKADSPLPQAISTPRFLRLR